MTARTYGTYTTGQRGESCAFCGAPLAGRAAIRTTAGPLVCFALCQDWGKR